MHLQGHVFIGLVVYLQVEQIAIVRLDLVGDRSLSLLPLLAPLLVLLVVFAVSIKLGWDIVVTLHFVDYAIFALNFLLHILLPGLVKN